MNPRSRDLDTFRGIVIADMMVQHFAGDAVLLGIPVQMFDFAVEGFVLLAGYAVGWHYLPRFRNAVGVTTRSLWTKAGKLLMIHWIMVLTIGIPFYGVFHLHSPEEVWQFSIESIFLLNQIPILHILPTFIPLFLLSPAVLLALENDHEGWLILVSAALFIGFTYSPNLLTIGENRVFPVGLWQIYFVAGSVLGKWSTHRPMPDPGRFFLATTALFIGCVLLKYGGYFAFIHSIKDEYNLYPKKFPLNVLGLVYGSALLAFIYGAYRFASGRAKGDNWLTDVLALIGRNSLFVFVIHAYAVFLVRSLSNLGVSIGVTVLGASLSVAGIVAVTRWIDSLRRAGRAPKAYSWLFS